MGSDGGPEGVLMGCRRGISKEFPRGYREGCQRVPKRVPRKGCPYGGPSECREGISWGTEGGPEGVLMG